MSSLSEAVGVEGVSAVLAAAIDSQETSFTVQPGGGVFPASAFQVKIDNEIMLVGSQAGGVFSGVSRAQEGTAAWSHPPGAPVLLVVGGEAIAAGGGGGSIPPVGVVLGQSAAIDINAVNSYTPIWDQMFDNTWDFNLIGNPATTPLPAGLGITYSPGDATYTVTEAGSWWLDLSIAVPADATVAIGLAPCFSAGLGEAIFLPTVARPVGDHKAAVYVGAVVTLPEGATPQPLINVYVAATANPLDATEILGTIVRIG